MPKQYQVHYVCTGTWDDNRWQAYCAQYPATSHTATKIGKAHEGVMRQLATRLETTVEELEQCTDHVLTDGQDKYMFSRIPEA